MDRSTKQVIDLFEKGLLVSSEHFNVENLSDGRQRVTLTPRVLNAMQGGLNDCAACDGITVWSDSIASGAGQKSVDINITLPRCAVSWTYHFSPHTAADQFLVNGVEYSGCVPLFGSPLPDKDGTVAVATSGRLLHIVVVGRCGTAGNSSWDGHIICNVA